MNVSLSQTESRKLEICTITTNTYCAWCNIANFADITRDTNKYGMLWCNVNVVEHELATIKHCRMIAMVAKKKQFICYRRPNPMTLEYRWLHWHNSNQQKVIGSFKLLRQFFLVLCTLVPHRFRFIMNDFVSGTRKIHALPYTQLVIVHWMCNALGAAAFFCYSFASCTVSCHVLHIYFFRYNLFFSRRRVPLPPPSSFSFVSAIVNYVHNTNGLM